MDSQFSLRGYYQYSGAPNGRGELEGTIKMISDTAFEGNIIDKASRSPNQIIKGHMFYEEGKSNLVFLKFPPRIELSNLLYDLKETSVKEGAGIWYSGEWKALPEKTIFLREIGLFFRGFDPSVVGVGDSARLLVSPSPSH